MQGDNDPVDVVEIGSTQLQTGGVYKVKAIGAYAMIDDGELDWKIVCIRADDPLAPAINDIEDVERCADRSCLGTAVPVRLQSCSLSGSRCAFSRRSLWYLG